MSIRYYLNDYLDERIPAEAPTLTAWAQWLASDKTAPFRTSPATPGETFAGFAAVELDRIDHVVGEPIPQGPFGATYFFLADNYEASGASPGDCLSDLDEGDEIQIVCVRDIARTYRFDLVDGAPVLVDIDPASAPLDPDRIRQALQPRLL